MNFEKKVYFLIIKLRFSHVNYQHQRQRINRQSFKAV